MNFLKLKQKLKIIPNDVRKITSATITDVDSGGFTVKLDSNENILSNKESEEEVFEILIPSDNYLVSFVSSPIETTESGVYFPIPKNYKTIQRREYTRININIPAHCKELSTNNNFDSVIDNLSGGGMQISSPKKLPLKILLEVKFNLHDKKRIDSEIEILRVKNDKEKFSLSGMFKKISNIDRITIIQLCFKRHLELRYKDINT